MKYVTVSVRSDWILYVSMKLSGWMSCEPYLGTSLTAQSQSIFWLFNVIKNSHIILHLIEGVYLLFHTLHTLNEIFIYIPYMYVMYDWCNVWILHAWEFSMNALLSRYFLPRYSLTVRVEKIKDIILETHRYQNV